MPFALLLAKGARPTCTASEERAAASSGPTSVTCCAPRLLLLTGCLAKTTHVIGAIQGHRREERARGGFARGRARWPPGGLPSSASVRLAPKPDRRGVGSSASFLLLFPPEGTTWHQESERNSAAWLVNLHTPFRKIRRCSQMVPVPGGNVTQYTSPRRNTLPKAAARAETTE